MVLVATALAIATKWGEPSIYDDGPQGFSETLYAYTSQGNNNGSAFAGFTGYLQPERRRTTGASGITFAEVLGGLAMLAGRFLPLLAVLAIAGSLAGKRVEPGRPRHAAHRHADVRRRPRGGRADRRPPHLRSRPAPRPRGPGPLRPALLTCASSETAIVAVVVLTAALGLAYPLAMTGAAQVAFPGRADGSMVEPDGELVGSRLIGQDFAGHPEYFQSRPSVTGYSPAATFFNNQGPNQEELADAAEANVRRYLRRERPFAPGLDAARHPVGRGHVVGLGRRPGHLGGQRAASRPTASQRSAASRSSRCSRSSTTTRAGRSSGSPVQRRSTCSSSTSRSTGRRRDDRPATAARGRAGLAGAGVRRDPHRPLAPALRARERRAQARPTGDGPQPGHVRGRAGRALHLGPVDRGRAGPAGVVRLHRRGVAVAHGALRQPRGSDRRGSRQGAGGDACERCARTPSRHSPTEPARRPPS